MGQRSQIYVRYENGNKKGLIANYYGWNYGERMISRAKAAIEDIKYTKYKNDYRDPINVQRLSRILDVNFDMRDYQMSQNIIAEYHEQFPDENFNDYVFLMQHNNDGKLFIDICGNNGEIVKYAFLDNEADSHHIMDGEGYMRWDNFAGDDEDWREKSHLSEEDIKVCEDNIKFISRQAELMTTEEIEEFINYNYCS